MIFYWSMDDLLVLSSFVMLITVCTLQWIKGHPERERPNNQLWYIHKLMNTATDRLANRAYNMEMIIPIEISQ